MTPKVRFLRRCFNYKTVNFDFHIDPKYGTLRAVDPLADYPSTEGLDPIAPEEDIPVPCGFTEVLTVMAMSESELMDTFLGLLESHIDPDLPKLPTSSSSRMTKVSLSL